MKKLKTKTLSYFAIVLHFIFIFFTLKITSESKVTYIFFLSVFVIAASIIAYISFKKHIFIRLKPHIQKHNNTSIIIFLLFVISISTYILFKDYNHIYFFHVNNVQFTLRLISLFGISFSLFFLYAIVHKRESGLSKEMVEDMDMELEEEMETKEKNEKNINSENEITKDINKTKNIDEFSSTNLEVYLKDELLWKKIINHETGQQFFNENGKLKDSNENDGVVVASLMHFLNQNDLFTKRFTLKEQVKISDSCFGISSSVNRRDNRKENLFNWVLELYK